MIATVDQSQVTLPILALDQSGQSTTVASGTVRVFQVDGGAESDVLAETALVNTSGSIWAYEWEPVSLAAGQYHVEYSLTDSGGSVYPAMDEITVLDTATAANVAASQSAIQSDISDLDTAVSGYVDASQTSVQADVAALDTAIDGYVSDSQTAVQASVAASQAAVQSDVADVQTGVDAVNAAIADVENAVLSDQELDAENNQIVLTNPVDHTTVIARFDTTNSDGDPAVTDVAQRVRV